eukprot:3941346-Rhodomonas_salina.4
MAYQVIMPEGSKNWRIPLFWYSSPYYATRLLCDAGLACTSALWNIGTDRCGTLVGGDQVHHPPGFDLHLLYHGTLSAMRSRVSRHGTRLSGYHFAVMTCAMLYQFETKFGYYENYSSRYQVTASPIQPRTRCSISGSERGYAATCARYDDRY